MTIECQRFDEKLLDFLYEELEESEQSAWRAHLDGCVRCRGEVDSFRRVRTAARGVTTLEPPSAVSAKLLYLASQQAPQRGVVPLLRRAARHPMYAMAASFVAVGGIVGLLWNTGLHRDAAMPASEPVAAVATEAKKGIDVTLPVAGEAANQAPAPVAAVPAERPEAPSDKPSSEAPGAVAAAARMASPAKEKLQWSAHKNGRSAVVEVTPSADSQRAAPSIPAEVSAGLVSKVFSGERAKATSGGDDRRSGPGKGGAPSSGAGAANEPLGSAYGARGPAATPRNAPPPIAAKQQQAVALEQKEGQRAQESNMRDGRRGELDRPLAQQDGFAAATSAPAPSAFAQQSAPATRSALADGSGEQQPVEVERLLQRLDQQTAANRCTNADETYRQLKEHFPERLTARANFDHARCQRVLGRFREARLEFDRLLVDAPSLRGKIEGELAGLSVEESSRRAAEAPTAAHAEKKPARPPAKAKAVDSADHKGAF